MAGAADSIAVLVAPSGPGGQAEPASPLDALIVHLAASGVAVKVVDDLGAAAELVAAAGDTPPCVLLDLRAIAASSDVEDIQHATEWIRRAVKALPHVAPVAVTGAADAALILACIRAGAGDVLDVALEGTGNARAIVLRVAARQRAEAGHAHDAANLRAIVEELLRDLIRTERRSIDLETQLEAQLEHPTGELSRPAALLLVEHDRALAAELAERLEAAGLATFAYTSGEHALREVDALLAAGATLDLAVVAAQLPGIDGVATVAALRDRIPQIPAFLMTAVADVELAARAADLGVVGFVTKPPRDLAVVVARLAALAHEALQRTRERTYLARIKERHERVLARYRSLPRQR